MQRVFVPHCCRRSPGPVTNLLSGSVSGAGHILTDVTARQARATGKPYTIADFDGLYLYVSAIGGGKARRLPYTWIGQRARISAGS